MHVFPTLQVPPFEHTGEHTAKKLQKGVERKSIFICYIRVVHVEPPQLAAQVQVFGALHVPPFWQGEAHLAKIRDPQRRKIALT